MPFGFFKKILDSSDDELKQLAIQLAKAGKFDEAKNLLWKIKDPTIKMYCALDLSVIMVSEGGFSPDDVVEMVESTILEYARYLALGKNYEGRYEDLYRWHIRLREEAGKYYLNREIEDPEIKYDILEIGRQVILTRMDIDDLLLGLAYVEILAEQAKAAIQMKSEEHFTPTIDEVYSYRNILNKAVRRRAIMIFEELVGEFEKIVKTDETLQTEKVLKALEYYKKLLKEMKAELPLQ